MDSPVAEWLDGDLNQDCGCSPLLPQSPISDLSLSIGNLSCQENDTLRRRLKLSPELQTPSSNSASDVSPDTKTLSGSLTSDTENTKSTERCFTTNRNSHKLKRQNERKSSKKSESDFLADKENKTYRVKLSSLFKSPSPPKIRKESERRKSKSPEHMVKREKKCQRRKTTSQGKTSETCELKPKRQLSPGSILDAAEKEGNLIGDFSKPYLLQLEKGDHQDLQYVSSHVVASLLKGEYDSIVKKYQIIDCRYPYEYEGGHIKGATNIYNEAQLQAAMFQEVCQSPSKNSYVDDKELTEKISLQSPPSRCTFGNSPTSRYLLQDSQHSANTELEDFAMSVKDQSPSAVSSSYDASAQRTLIIFYCEFSSERGPRICRHLRKIDRNINVYPQLYYPELYILKGGYKEFYSQFKSVCEPCSYLPMLHKDFSEQLRRYRRKRRFRSVQFRRKQLFESEIDVQ